MAAGKTTNQGNVGQARQQIDGPKAVGNRTNDDLELLKIILDENPKLKSRVMYVIKSAIDKKNEKVPVKKSK